MEEKKNDDGKAKEEEEKSKEVKEVKAAEPKKKTETAEDEDGPDDFLKLDATAEVDEFSQFLNEFEDEVLDESKQKEQAAVKMKKEKKERPPTEKKVVDGKKLRKKVRKKFNELYESMHHATFAGQTHPIVPFAPEDKKPKPKRKPHEVAERRR